MRQHNASMTRDHHLALGRERSDANTRLRRQRKRRRGRTRGSENQHERCYGAEHSDAQQRVEEDVSPVAVRIADGSVSRHEGDPRGDQHIAHTRKNQQQNGKQQIIRSRFGYSGRYEHSHHRSHEPHNGQIMRVIIARFGIVRGCLRIEIRRRVATTTRTTQDGRPLRHTTQPMATTVRGSVQRAFRVRVNCQLIAGGVNGQRHAATTYATTNRRRNTQAAAECTKSAK